MFDRPWSIFPYHCDVEGCTRRFAFAGNLATHKRAIHQERISSHTLPPVQPIPDVLITLLCKLKEMGIRSQIPEIPPSAAPMANSILITTHDGDIVYRQQQTLSTATREQLVAISAAFDHPEQSWAQNGVVSIGTRKFMYITCESVVIRPNPQLSCQKILALCMANHPRLGKESSIGGPVALDILEKIFIFLHEADFHPRMAVAKGQGDSGLTMFKTRR
jgi:hypothetical protein